MRGVRVGAALLAVLLTAACTDGSTGAEPSPEPDVSVTDTATETGSPTPDSRPTPPLIPEAATKPTKAGAVAFARHYFEMVNYSLGSLDTKPLRALTFQCRGCDGGADFIDGVASKGGSIDGGAYTPVGRVRAVPLGTGASEARYGVRFTMSISPQVMEVPGAERDRYPGGERPVAVTVDWRDGSWSVGLLEFP